MSQEHRRRHGPPTCPPSSHLDNIAVSQSEGQFGLFLYARAILQGHLQVDGHHLALERAAGARRAWDQGLLPQQPIPCGPESESAIWRPGRGLCSPEPPSVHLGTVNTSATVTRGGTRPCASSTSALPNRTELGVTGQGWSRRLARCFVRTGQTA